MNLFQSEQFGKHIQDLLSQWRVPGLCVAITNAAGDLHAKAFGHASFEPDTAMTTDHIFDMASCSKSLTAAAVAKLIADSTEGAGSPPSDFSPPPGLPAASARPIPAKSDTASSEFSKAVSEGSRIPRSEDPGDLAIPKTTERPITWTTTVNSLLPDDFVLPDPIATTQATIEDILSHRTGMPDHSNSYLGIDARTSDTPRSITRNLRNLPMTAPPRTKMQYSNDMYIVATHLIETLSSQSFGTYLQHNIFDVLDMSSTFLQPSAVKAAGQEHRIAKPYIWNEGFATYSEMPLAEQPEAQGAGSIKSTVLDYAKWAQALLRQDERLFSKDVYRELVKPRILLNPEDNEEELLPFMSHDSYALGLCVSFYRGHRIVQHDGSIFGYGAKLLFMPAHDFGLVVCGNTDGDVVNEVAEILAMELIDEVLGVPQDLNDVDRFDSSRRQPSDVFGTSQSSKLSRQLHFVNNDNDNSSLDVDGFDSPRRQPSQAVAVVSYRLSAHAGERVDWAKLKWDKAQEEPTSEQKKQAIVDDISPDGCQPLDLPLSAYVGTYYHVGYHEITVTGTADLDIKLWDRSDPSHLFLSHVCDNTKFVAEMVTAVGGGEYLKAEFRLGEDGRVEALGIDFVEEMEGELIWFDRVESHGMEHAVEKLEVQ